MFASFFHIALYHHSKTSGTHHTHFGIHKNSKIQVFFSDSVQPFSCCCVDFLHSNRCSPQKHNSVCTTAYSMMNHKPFYHHYPIGACVLYPVPWLRSQNCRGFIGDTTIADKDRLAWVYCWRTSCEWFPLYAHEKDSNHHNCLFLIQVKHTKETITKLSDQTYGSSSTSRRSKQQGTAVHALSAL